MRRLVVLALVAVTVLAGCGDDRPCLSGHHETTLMPILVGKVTVLMPVDTFVCDKHGPKPSKS